MQVSELWALQEMILTSSHWIIWNTDFKDEIFFFFNVSNILTHMYSFCDPMAAIRIDQKVINGYII